MGTFETKILNAKEIVSVHGFRIRFEAEPRRKEGVEAADYISEDAFITQKRNRSYNILNKFCV